MPRMTAAVFGQFLEQPCFGTIATLRRDGRPYTVPVIWLWEPDEEAPVLRSGSHVYPGGTIWMTGTTSRLWCRQLIADPRASLCIESTSPISGHVGLDGVCEPLFREEHDIWPMTRRLLEKYSGATDVAAATDVDTHLASLRNEPRMLFRMRPDVVRAIDMRVYRGKRSDSRD